MNLLLLLVHGLSAVLLWGALTHQALALWWPGPRSAPGWWGGLRAVHAERYAQAVVVLFISTLALGAILYAPFRVVVRADYMDAQVPWATGLFEIKEHAAAIGLALLPAYLSAWRDESGARARRGLTTLLALIVWFNYLVGHVVNNVRGL
jgi:hypothetical protein